MDNSWENKNKNLIDKYNVRNIYLNWQITSWLFVAVFSAAMQERVGLCFVLNADMINLQPTFMMMFTNGLIKIKTKNIWPWGS